MTTKNAKNVKTKGPAQTAKCTMPPQACKRFGITPEQNGRGATDFGTVYRSKASAKFVKRMTEGMRTLRQMQGKTDITVPAPVRSAIKYFSIPFARGEEKPVRHKLDAYEATGDDPTKVTLKV
jgi:hypothetical protein